MDARSRADQLREASNPLFNDRKLKLGTFCSNLSGGCTMSSIEKSAKPRLFVDHQLDQLVGLGDDPI